MITSYPASSQRLPVPGVISCVFKHRAALSPQTLIHFPFCSSSACGRQIFGMGTENHMQRGAAAAGESTLRCLHSGGPWADTPPGGTSHGRRSQLASQPYILAVRGQERMGKTSSLNVAASLQVIIGSLLPCTSPCLLQCSFCLRPLIETELFRR